MSIERIIYVWLIFGLVYFVHVSLEARARPPRSERSEISDISVRSDEDLKSGVVLRVRVCHQ
jgi:hypothetical protein